MRSSLPTCFMGLPRFFSCERISPSANRPIRTVISPKPPLKRHQPKVKRSSEDSLSMPIIASIMPIIALIRPLIISSLHKEMTTARPIMPSAKYSHAPNIKPKRASFVATKIMTTPLNRPPIRLAVAP